MHKLHKFFILASVLIFASCINEMESGQTDTDGADEGSFVLEVSIDDPTRTALGSSDASVYHTVWNEGDMISVNGIMSYPVPAESAGKSKAAFSFDGFPMLPLNLLYPATEETAFVEFPITQTYVKDSFDPRAAVMYGTSDGFENVFLAHLSSVLRFSFTSAEETMIKCILVRADSKEPLAGTFEMETDEKGSFTGNMSPAAGSSSMVILDCGEGVALSSAPTPFHVAVPYGTYSGFSIQVIALDGSVMQLGYTPANSGVLAPSKVVVFPDKAFVADGVAKLIGNEADLLAFAEAATEYSTVVLIDDIAVTSEEFSSIKDFSGTFEGGDYTISGLKAPLFDNLTGNVSNLNLQGEIIENAVAEVGMLARTSDGGNVLGCSSSGSVTFAVPADGMNDISLGGLVGIVKSGTVASCFNDATVNVSSLTARNIYMGGVVGKSYSALSSLRNFGSIVSANDVIVENAAVVGGVVGSAYNAVDNIVNEGSVVINSKSAILYASAVLGATVLENADISRIKATTSSSLTIAPAPDADNKVSCYAGGLVGYHSVHNSRFSDSDNASSVNITIPSDSKMCLYASGIIGYSYSEIKDSELSVSLTGIVNNGSVSVDGSALIYGDTGEVDKPFTSRSLFGGIIGKAYIKGKTFAGKYDISNCINNGIISLNVPDSKRLYVGGIVGESMVSDLTMTNCCNNGDITAKGPCEYICLAGHLGVVWREAETRVKIEGAENRGCLTLNDENSSSYSYAGGIVGLANGTGANSKLDLDVRNCSNSGRIYRFVSGESNKAQSFGGGIIGAIGLNNNTISYKDKNGEVKTIVADFVKAEIFECVNSGEIIFNQYSGQKEFKEKAITYSFTGGIVGLSKAVNGLVEVKHCINNGDILSTSGQHGGIVGFVHSSTAIYGDRSNYCRNTGMVGISDAKNVKAKGSENLVAGGICGYMNDKGKGSKIEYCWNSGIVAGSTKKLPGSGGIVGQIKQIKLDDEVVVVVQYCKNSGWVRSTSNYAGLITGSSHDVKVKNCAVGGRISKSEGDWYDIVAVQNDPDTERVIYKFVYGDHVDLINNKEVEFESNGIKFWDGVSKTSWEE